jgi:hypothetical protein
MLKLSELVGDFSRQLGQSIKEETAMRNPKSDPAVSVRQ